MSVPVVSKPRLLPWPAWLYLLAAAAILLVASPLATQAGFRTGVLVWLLFVLLSLLLGAGGVLLLILRPRAAAGLRAILLGVTTAGLWLLGSWLDDRALVQCLVQRAERLDAVVQALEQHRRDTGALPVRLDALLPKYLPAEWRADLALLRLHPDPQDPQQFELSQPWPRFPFAFVELDYHSQRDWQSSHGRHSRPLRGNWGLFEGTGSL